MEPLAHASKSINIKMYAPILTYRMCLYKVMLQVQRQFSILLSNYDMASHYQLKQ